MNSVQPIEVKIFGSDAGRLQVALATLPEAFRTAVMLCDVEGKSYEEIAQSMGSSIGTVRSRIHRGRTMLRRLMNSPIKSAKSDERGRGQQLPPLFTAQPA